MQWSIKGLSANINFPYQYYLMETQADGLIVDEASKRQWAFTLRRTNLKRGLPTEETYHKFLEALCLRNHSKISEFCFEQTNGLHMHGIIDIPIYILMHKFRTRGWKLHLVELWDKYGWRNYMAKEALLYFKAQEQGSPVADATPPLLPLPN